MQQQGWTRIPGAGSVFIHQPSHAICVVYVDDMLLLARAKDAGKFWRALESKIRFKDPEQPLQRYLGARYRFDDVNTTKPNASRKLLTDMDEYAINAVKSTDEHYTKSPALTSQTKNWLRRVTTTRYLLGHAPRMWQLCFFWVELPGQTYL